MNTSQKREFHEGGLPPLPDSPGNMHFATVFYLIEGPPLKTMGTPGGP